MRPAPRLALRPAVAALQHHHRRFIPCSPPQLSSSSSSRRPASSSSQSPSQPDRESAERWLESNGFRPIWNGRAPATPLSAAQWTFTRRSRTPSCHARGGGKEQPAARACWRRQEPSTASRVPGSGPRSAFGFPASCTFTAPSPISSPGSPSPSRIRWCQRTCRTQRCAAHLLAAAIGLSVALASRDAPGYLALDSVSFLKL
jgi:hypothetical protein